MPAAPFTLIIIGLFQAKGEFDLLIAQKTEPKCTNGALDPHARVRLTLFLASLGFGGHTCYTGVKL